MILMIEYVSCVSDIMKDNSKFLRKAVSVIFSFFLFLAMTTLFFIVGIYFGLFNDNNFLNKMNENNYYNEIYEKVTEKVTEVLDKADIPKSVGKKVFTLKRVYIDEKNYVEQTLNGNKYTINTEKLKSNLRKYVYQYLETENITLTEEIATGVDNVIELSVREYERIITFTLADYYQQYKGEFSKYVPIVLGISCGLMVGLSILLLMIHKRKYRGIRYIAYSTLGAALMNLLPAVYLLLSKKYERIQVQPKYYQNFLVSHIQSDLNMFIYVSIMGFVLFTILLLIIKFLKHNGQ